MNLLIIFLFILLFFIFNNFIETLNLPWWNSTRRTRNMIYDIRGEPLIIPKKKFIWNNSDRYY
jgi:hypothetical protein